jgi:hypothetical protein
MNFVGKILVVLLLVLSVLFLSFAAVVHSTHMNWKKVAEDRDKKIKDANAARSNVEADFNRFKDEMDLKLKTAIDQATTMDAANKILQGELAQVKKSRDENAIARKSSGEQAEVASEEALARHSEADVQRAINHAQQLQLDQNIETITKLEDQVHNLELALKMAGTKNKDLLAKISIFQQALEAAGITADANELAGRISPPPKVDGVILDNRPARRLGAAELVEISLGSDDGLKKGHEMSIYRSGSKSGTPARFLGKMVIVKTEPDRAVGEVIESSRNGVIQKGDNVTTKL